MKIFGTVLTTGIMLLALLQISHGQASTNTIVSIVAAEEGLSPVPSDDIPLTGTFWVAENSFSNTYAVPWPCPPPNENPTYSLPNGVFLVDDTTNDASALSPSVITNEAMPLLDLIDMEQAEETAQQSGMSRAMVAHANDLPTLPDDGTNNDYGTNVYTGYSSYTLFDPGTNLWIAQWAMTNGAVAGIASNTIADVPYEVLITTNLAGTNWTSEGFIYGSELTNWTQLGPLPVNPTANLFFLLKSWQDSTDTGIPDWWWLEYFGQLTNVDEYAEDPAGDGYINLDKFQMGLDPTNYYNPNPTPDFFGCLDASGTNACLEWSLAPGPVLNYVIVRGVQDIFGGYSYSQIGLLSSNTTFFVDVGAITNANAQNNIYDLTAVYPSDSVSATDTWQVGDYAIGFGPPYGPPLPGNLYAYSDSTGTNVLVSWTYSSPGTPTNYLVFRGVFDASNFDYDYYQIATVSTNTTYFYAINVMTNAANANDIYEIEAVYPGGGLSQPASTSISSIPPQPTDVTALPDPTGTNVLISWGAPPGITVSNYLIERGIYNTNTSSYDYTQIAIVGEGTNWFTDNGAITNTNNYNLSYVVEAIYSDGTSSEFAEDVISEALQLPPNYNIHLTAYLIRNGTGRWQVMFSGYSTNAQTIQLIWTGTDGNIVTQQDILTTNLIASAYAIPDADIVNFMGDSLSVQLFGPNGEPGQVAQAGVVSTDAPYFVDGREHSKQNLEFLIRAASAKLPFESELGSSGYAGNLNQNATNFEEFSFIHHDALSQIVTLDDLWPFNLNYYLDNFLIDTNRADNDMLYGNTNFNFTFNFANNIPGAARLGDTNNFLIIQPAFENNFYEMTGDNLINEPSWGVTLENSNATASLESSLNNFYGLPYGTGMFVDLIYGLDPGTGGLNPIPEGTPGLSYYQSISPGGSVTSVNFPVVGEYLLGAYASFCQAPTLVLTNYYFAPIDNPDENETNMPSVDQQSFPLPVDDNFNVTNQTPPLIVGTIGQPMIIGSWAKYAISNSSPTKYAYLGQYFTTNVPLLNFDGSTSTNNAGILSPYGEFFPLQAGIAQLTTMPDVDTGQQGTNFVRIISMNVDANHDGTMDFTYSGPDQTAPPRPFRFWINDNIDAGDDGGDYGVPGQGLQSDGMTPLFSPQFQPSEFNYLATERHWGVHGRRDLVDYFPVYLNIASLFTSNSLSTGIDPQDTNYTFVLSQADGALRFAYTSLTATNYMNFLRDTNESGLLSGANLFTISNTASGGCTLLPSFVNEIATNNEGIILVEAWTNTTQPLVLTICHGTNQIAQTELFLSMSGVEQMFRNKTIMLRPIEGTVPDRLTDADVPNEPETTDKNFVFLHGYNVLPDENRGVASDVFKRMYWSGSHAKFWAVTWEGADSKGSPPFYKALTPNYHTNVANAFVTAPILTAFIETLTNTGPVVAAAHSLGNIVTLSAISDWNVPLSKFFMIDAAVAIEAIDPSATTNMMVYSTGINNWPPYANRLYASYWYQLFPTNDARSTLTWNGRLNNLGSVDVYNFFSSGEEVLRTTTNDPPDSVLNKVATQATYHFWDGFPFGSFTWYWQEKGKGTCSQDWFLGSSHGGWQMNYHPPYLYVTNGLPAFTTPEQALAIPDSQLQTNAFFNFASSIITVADTNLLGADGSDYAQANRNRILANTIPAMSMVAGANPIPSFSDSHNIDEMSLKNGWSTSRTGPEVGMWHHSDFQQMAYTFTYKLFDKFVATGNLK